jgi:hypothetical protein
VPTLNENGIYIYTHKVTPSRKSATSERRKSKNTGAKIALNFSSVLSASSPVVISPKEVTEDTAPLDWDWSTPFEQIEPSHSLRKSVGITMQNVETTLLRMHDPSYERKPDLQKHHAAITYAQRKNRQSRVFQNQNRTPVHSLLSRLASSPDPLTDPKFNPNTSYLPLSSKNMNKNIFSFPSYTTDPLLKSD